MAPFASIDVFTVPTATLRVWFAVVVLAHDRRRILHLNVTAHPAAAWTAQPVREAWPDDTAPRVLLRDRDAIDGPESRRTAAAMGLEGLVTAPRAPWQNPFVERLMGSLRREGPDHVIIWNAASLRRGLQQDLAYYQLWRAHLSLEKAAPVPRRTRQPIEGTIAQVAHLGGLHHHDERRAARPRFTRPPTSPEPEA